MDRHFRVLAAAGGLLAAFSVAEAAYAQKQGGVLKIYFFDSPASVSIHEETTAAGQGPVHRHRITRGVAVTRVMRPW